MKSLLTIFTLLFTVMFSSASFAEWTKVNESVNGHTYYVDLERTRKHDGYVYYWQLTDYIKPTKIGHSSSKIYVQGDCNLIRYKYLSWSFHKGQMGGGTSLVDNDSDKNWTYPTPNSVTEGVLKEVCSQ